MFKKLLFNEASDTSSQGGSSAPPASQPASQTAPEPKGSFVNDTSEIDKMYGQKPQEPAQVQPTQEGIPTKATDAKPLNGYEAPPPGESTGYKPAEGESLPTEETTEPAKTEASFDESGLSKDQIIGIKNFIAANKLSKEAAQEYVALAKGFKAQVEAYQKEQQTKVQQAAQKQKQEWYNELKQDKEFGGQNFDVNLKRVDTVLDRFFPNTKKELTTRKSMLPPSVMRDLLSVHKALLGSEGTLVTPNSVGSEEGDDFTKFLGNFYK